MMHHLKFWGSMQKAKGLLYSFKNYLLRNYTHEKYKTTKYGKGKQTTFICSYCGQPIKMPNKNVYLQQSELSAKLPSSFFEVKKAITKLTGLKLEKQIQHYEEISDEGSLITCGNCNASRFQNILMLKVMNINIGVLI